MSIATKLHQREIFDRDKISSSGKLPGANNNPGVDCGEIPGPCQIPVDPCIGPNKDIIVSNTMISEPVVLRIFFNQSRMYRNFYCILFKFPRNSQIFSTGEIPEFSCNQFSLRGAF